MKRTALLGVASLMAIGCSAVDTPMDDGYQFGDLTRTAIQLQNDVCENGDPVAELALWALLNKARPLTAGVNLCDLNIVDYLKGQADGPANG